MSVHLLLSKMAAFKESDLHKLEQAYQEAYPGFSFQAEVQTVTKAAIRSLNQKHRGIDEPTDVLSFPTFAHFSSIKLAAQQTVLLLGSIVICPAKAREYREPLLDLVHHGLLHLLGFDHEKDALQWKKEEDRVLQFVHKQGLSVKGVPHDAL